MITRKENIFYQKKEGEYRCHLTILKGHAGQLLFVVVGRDATLHFCGCGMLQLQFGNVM